MQIKLCQQRKNINFADAVFCMKEEKSFIHPSNIQQISLSLLITKSAKGLHTREANQRLWIHQKHEKTPNSSVRSLKKLKPKLKPKLEPLFHHEFSAETGSRAKWTQNLNHRSAKH